MKNGVPMDAAFAMCPVDTSEIPLDVEGLAMAVVFGEIEGGQFDWDNMEWIERNG